MEPLDVVRLCFVGTCLCAMLVPLLVWLAARDVRPSQQMAGTCASPSKLAVAPRWLDEDHRNHLARRRSENEAALLATK